MDECVVEGKRYAVKVGDIKYPVVLRADDEDGGHWV